MALAFRGSAKNKATTASVDLTVTFPGGVAANDVVIAAYAISNFSAAVDWNLAVTTAGYTELFPDLYAEDTYDGHLGVFRKVMGGTPDSTVAFTGVGDADDPMIGAVHIWSGADTTTPEDATPTTATGINSTVPDSPSITTVTAGAVVLSIGASGCVANDITVTAPTNYINLINDGLSNDSDITLMISSRLIAVAGAENPAAYSGITTNIQDSWCAASVAIRPAGAAKSLVVRPQWSRFQPMMVR